MSKTRPYITTYNGKPRLIEAVSREQVRDHLLAPILKDITPQLDTIRPASAAEVAKHMRGGGDYEEVGAPVDELLTFSELEDGMLVHIAFEAVEGKPCKFDGIFKLTEEPQCEVPYFYVNAPDPSDPEEEIQVIFHPGWTGAKIRRLTDEERQSYLDLPAK